MRVLNKCICGRRYYAKSKSGRYCPDCIALSKKRKLPVAVLKGKMTKEEYLKCKADAKLAKQT